MYILINYTVHQFSLHASCYFKKSIHYSVGQLYCRLKNCLKAVSDGKSTANYIRKKFFKNKKYLESIY